MLTVATSGIVLQEEVRWTAAGSTIMIWPRKKAEGVVAAEGSAMKEKKAGAVSRGFGRREFGQRAALALTGVALAGEPFSGFAHGSAAVSPAALPEEQEDAQGLSSQAQAEIESKLQHIFAVYGPRLNEDQRKLLRRTVTYHVRMLEAVRPIAVANGDSPATVLKLVRKSEPNAREARRISRKSRDAARNLNRQR